jgi:hypothetical protein
VRIFFALTLFHIAARIGIAIVAFKTAADRLVVFDVAKCVETTRSNAWILAILTEAGTVRRAILINCALRSAVWWSTEHSWQT